MKVEKEFLAKVDRLMVRELTMRDERIAELEGQLNVARRSLKDRDGLVVACREAKERVAEWKTLYREQVKRTNAAGGHAVVNAQKLDTASWEYLELEERMEQAKEQLAEAQAKIKLLNIATGLLKSELEQAKARERE